MDKTTQTNVLKTLNPMAGMDFSGATINMNTIKSTGNITDYYGN